MTCDIYDLDHCHMGLQVMAGLLIIYDQQLSEV